MSGIDPGSFTTFGELLKYLRQRARLTQRQLGIAVGYSDAQINRLESGQRLPDPTVVKARFIDALSLQDEPTLAQRLIELADMAQDASMKPAASQDKDQAGSAVSSSAVPTNLPEPLTRFIGRQQDIADVQRLFASNRLVTLTGSGGVGKTRLALEVTAQTISRQPATVDGLWLVELAPVTDPELVPDIVAATLGLSASTRPAIERLTVYMGDMRVMILLDNCEHLIGGCAEFAEKLLMHALACVFSLPAANPSISRGR